MYLGVKQIRKLDGISVFAAVLEDYGYDFAEEGPPSMWSENEAKLFDMMVEVEKRFLCEVLRIVAPEENSGEPSNSNQQAQVDNLPTKEKAEKC